MDGQDVENHLDDRQDLKRATVGIYINGRCAVRTISAGVG